MMIPGMMKYALILALTAPVVATPSLALADDPGERAARRHYERGEKLFAARKFDEALDEYQKAFDANPLPDFLFNIGQCYRNLGDYEAAVFSYKKFLKLDPEAPNRAKVEKLIDDLEKKIERGDSEKFKLAPKKKKPRDDDDTVPKEVPEGSTSSPVYKKWWFWTGIVVGGAAAGAGIYFLTRPSGPEADYQIVFTK